MVIDSAGTAATGPRRGSHAAATAIALALGGASVYFVLALLCVYLSRQPQGIATMWLPDAFASIYLLLLRPAQRRWVVLALALTIPLANLSYGDPWRTAWSFVPANLLQIVLSAWLLERHVQPRLAVVEPWHLLRALLLGGALPALAGATAAAMVVPVMAGTALGPSVTRLWWAWLVSSFFGVATLLPMGLWMLARGTDLSALRRPPVLLALAMVALVCWAASAWLPVPLVYVVATLVLAAVFGGFVVSAAAALVAALVLNTVLALGLVPLPGGHGTGVLSFALPMLVTVVPAVLIGAVREGLQAQISRVSAGEALLRSMLDASPTLLCLVDEDERVVRMNAAGARLLGAPDALALHGRRLADWLHLPAEAPAGRAELHTLDGRRLQVELHRAPLHLPTGEGGAVYALHDMTAELEAGRMRAESRAKSEFLSRMSHELRTPLNAVLGFAQLLESSLHETPPERQRQHLQQISQAGWHLLSMIDDVLELARLEAGQGARRSQALALGPVVAQACAMVQSEAARRSVQVSMQACDEARVQADPLRLRQVLINLLSNAVKYNRPGGQVQVCCRRDADGWQLSVADTGVGIRPERQAQVFEPFNRLDQEGSATPGTGIGLSITRRLVEEMAGRIGFESRPGEGSTFWVTLPAAAEAG